jgi:hypothetical protein
MTIPSSRDELIEYCLRKLGKPVIEINVSDDQVQDRIDEALKYYYDYHFDGAEKMYLKYQVTETDVANKYLTIPENIIGVVNIFDIGSAIASANMFDIRYQIALNDLYQYTNDSIVPYYLNIQRIRMYEEILVGKQPIRYNRHINKLYIDMSWAKIKVGSYIIVEAYQVVDPTVYTDAWGDRWLAKYATSLIKRQWGSNLTKYSNIPLMGGITFNGDKILAEAEREIAELESEMISSYSLPVVDLLA